MKIAICYSGQYRPYKGWKENHYAHLPKNSDFFYSTWSNEKPRVQENNMIYFDQPLIDYNCYSGKFSDKYGKHIINKGSEKHRHFTACLQHLAHWYILQHALDYDIVIRMRYDTVIGKHDWYSLCKISYKTGKAIGIGNANAEDDANPKMHEKEPRVYKTKDFMLDFMTIHKPRNIANVINLHEKKALWPTNAGWWLILSEPGYGDYSYRGGIHLARLIHKEIIWL